MTGLFITGTDTGIGKTLVGCGLAAAWTAQGKRVGVLKPAETGCTERNGDWYPDDAVRLAGFAGQAADGPEDWARLCPYRFPLPVAPSVAAWQAGVCIEPERLVQRFSDVAERHDVTIVEGAGGLLVPLVGRYSFADLARDLAVPVLVVVGSKLRRAEPRPADPGLPQQPGTAAGRIRPQSSRCRIGRCGRDQRRDADRA